MDRLTRLLIENWTVDYGDGHSERISVPHAWRQDVPVAFEGPVVYRTEIEIPRKPSILRFHGVSYSAEVAINGTPVAKHLGIWDAFDVPLLAYQGKRVAVEVTVVKNGGSTYPVKDVASGFLPYVFNTLGGMYGDVELLDADAAPLEQPFPGHSRVAVDGHKILVDGLPFYPRGLLSWGWYPELGHTNAPEDVIRAEVQAAKKLGFNLIKFCLWVPPHRYLKILREEGMEAWLELPLWDPSSDTYKLQAIALEIERILRQYRHHDNIICWTVGCELSHATPPEYRERLVQTIKNLTGSPLVKDNSGGAEMYGGDLREFGDFDDFHPYCDLPFYPPVLDSLLPGPRPNRPVLLGEFNDIDLHRDVARLSDDLPYWASRMSELNAQGVRWLHPLPDLLPENRFAQEPGKNKHRLLMESSRQKAIFIRKFVQEAVRARQAISGYVVTGLCDTPISTSGFFDSWGDVRFTAQECLPWNGPDVLFLIPTRRPPWIDGGNRPGWIDPFNYFAGPIFFRVGVHSERGLSGGLLWTILDGDRIVAQGAFPESLILASEPREVGQISWQCDVPGRYLLRVEFGGAVNEWPFNVFAPWSDEDKDLSMESIEFRVEEGTVALPFWREAAYEFYGDAWGLAENWERLLAISPDRALDPTSLEEHEVIINRIDTRTYLEHPIAVRTKTGKVVTTLRPNGGLGIQPIGLERNPSGAELLRRMTSQ
jgi:hypothetical protein